MAITPNPESITPEPYYAPPQVGASKGKPKPTDTPPSVGASSVAKDSIPREAASEDTMDDRTEGKPPFNELSVLFPLLSFVTAGYLALMLADFLLKEALDLPEGILPVYIGLLGAYAADKEVRRWLVTPEPARKGSIFVYLWVVFFVVAYVIHTFRPDYALPANLITVCLQVIGIFFGSRTSKYAWEKYQNSRSESDSGRERLILDLIDAKGQVTRQQVIEQLGVSGSTVNRLLQGMEARKLVRRLGEGRGVYYMRP